MKTDKIGKVLQTIKDGLDSCFIFPHEVEYNINQSIQVDYRSKKEYTNYGICVKIKGYYMEGDEGFYSYVEEYGEEYEIVMCYSTLEDIFKIGKMKVNLLDIDNNLDAIYEQIYTEVIYLFHNSKGVGIVK